jgi:hypothetical protein
MAAAAPSVLIDGDPSDRLCFDRIFRSPAFDTFMSLHTIGENETSRDQPSLLKMRRSAAGGGRGMAAIGCIPAGAWVVPYTGVFVPRNHGDHDSDSGRNAAVRHGPLKQVADRDMTIEWCVFNGDSGMRTTKECSGFIRGWATTTQPLLRHSAAFINHRCLRPNCAYTVVDIYIFLDSDGGAVEVLYDGSASSVVRKTDDDAGARSSSSLLLLAALFHGKKKKRRRRIGRKIDGNGVLLPLPRCFELPPTIPPKITGDNIYLIGWPVVETIRPVADGQELNANYGDGYIAISPHLPGAPTTSDTLRREHWEDAIQAHATLHGNKFLKFCECEDCLMIPDTSLRSVFLSP